MNHLRFNLNGRWVEETLPPTTTLLRYLRDTAGLTGTKEGCAEGDCGACTVAVAETAPDGKPHWRAVNACLLLLPMVQGKTVVTVEALREADGAYHPAQEAMARALGSQCGYCTPGIVMSLFEATYRDDMQAEPWKLDDQLCGNLCRCTGYRPIREAAQKVCGTCPVDRFSTGLAPAVPGAMELNVDFESQRFHTPIRIGALWDVLDLLPDARFVVGGTDLCLDITKRFARLDKLVSLEGIPELRKLEKIAGALPSAGSPLKGGALPSAGSPLKDSAVPSAGSPLKQEVFRLGATATVAELEDWSKSRLPALARMLRYFGARQIKHRGTLGGSLCTASPIGDFAPVLISLGAQVVLASRVGERKMPLEEFFVGYRKTALGPKEILAAVEVPRPAAAALSCAYKVSKRRELDISTVAAGFFVEVDAASLVTVARLAFGGMSATPRRAAKAEAALVGQPWSQAAVEAAAAKLAEDFTPLSDHRGSASFRTRIAANLLRGFFEETRVEPQPSLRPLHTATVQAHD